MTNRKLLFCYSILLFASLSLIPQIANSEPLDNWNLRRPLSTNNDLYKVAYGNGVFVAVGDAGTMITSLDGWTWSLQTSGIHYDLSNVSYLNGLFFAVTGSNKNPHFFRRSEMVCQSCRTNDLAFSSNF